MFLCCIVCVDLTALDWQKELVPRSYTYAITPLAAQKRRRSSNLDNPAVQLQLPPCELAPASLQPKTPRPDLTIGLKDSDAAWNQKAEFWKALGLSGNEIRPILASLQARDTFWSDPCTTSPSQLRFPFFVVELKSGNNATMVDAENQAAVSGAIALDLLQKLGAGYAGQDEEADTTFRLRTYSCTTEGAMCTLWAHLPNANGAEGSYMAWIQTYRITNAVSARDFIHAVGRILAWGATEYKDWVLKGVAGTVRGALS